MFWTSGKRRHWPPKSTGNPLTLADNSTSTLTIRRMWNEDSYTDFTIELPPYAKNDKIWLTKSGDWGVISSSAVFPEVLLTRSLIPSVTVVWTKRKSLWTLCISHIWRVFQRSSNVYGIDTTTGRSSELNTLLEDHSWKPGRKEIRNRRHIASVAFPVNVAEATLAKQQTSSRGDPWTQAQSPTGSFIKIKISPTCLWRGP
jgi:hypothetical protein